jgi:penicillin-binding protein activator
MNRRFLAPLLLPVLVIAASGCGKEVVRGANDPSIDSHAVSTGLDKDDIQRALAETLNQLRTAPVMNEWRTTNPKPTVAVLPFRNTTSEHIDSMLDAMLSETESWLLDAQVVDVVAHERQREMIGEVRMQQNQDFDASTTAKLGKQLGVKYFITGKVQGADERSDDMRRVQYFVFLQVIEADSSRIKFQKKTYITKAIK